MRSSVSRQLVELIAPVLADPGDATDVRALALALVGAGEPELASRGLAAACRLFAAAGQLPMALVAVKELEPVDEATAAKLVDELQRRYGPGSTQVDPAFRAAPPRVTDDPPGRPPSPKQARAKAVEAVAAAEAEAVRRGGARLPKIPLFHHLGPTSFRRLVERVELQERSTGEVVVEAGEPGVSCFVIARGTVRIERPRADGEPLLLSHLRGGALFGEMALLTDSPRNARAVCESPTLLFELSRPSVEELAAAAPELAAVLADHTRDRLLQNLMLTSGLFSPLGLEARGRLVARFEPRAFAPGELLLEEGAEGGHLHVLLSGEVAVEKREGGDLLTITRLGPGEVVGEISLLSHRPATATVRARSRTLTLALARADFAAVVGEVPELIAHLYQVAMAREQDLARFLADAVVEADEYLI